MAPAWDYLLHYCSSALHVVSVGSDQYHVESMVGGGGFEANTLIDCKSSYANESWGKIMTRFMGYGDA